MGMEQKEGNEAGKLLYNKGLRIVVMRHIAYL
jgi:hypothetical protein